jgi:hypothetical protein
MNRKKKKKQGKRNSTTYAMARKFAPWKRYSDSISTTGLSWRGGEKHTTERYPTPYRCRIQLDVDLLLGQQKILQQGADPLRRATQTVAILPKLTLRVGFLVLDACELRGLEDVTDIGGDLDLAHVWARYVV